uniref:Serine/threonine-protein phosphatase n=1 Tax=Alexandrium monilatum TaxID=311494 RepID=A0A7S4QH93_9DINO
MGPAPSSCRSAASLPAPAFCHSCKFAARSSEEEAADADPPILVLSDEGLESMGEPKVSQTMLWESQASERRPPVEDPVQEVSQPLEDSMQSRRTNSQESLQDQQTLLRCGTRDSAEGGLNSMVRLSSIAGKMRRFRTRMSQEEPPTEHEIVRGVQVQRVYDFYDCAARKIRVRKMFDDVLHARANNRLDSQGEEDDNESCASGSRRSSISSTRTPSDYSPDEGDGVTRLQSAQKVTSHTNQDKVAMWGVLVGGLMYKHYSAIDVLCCKTDSARSAAASSGHRRSKRLTAEDGYQPRWHELAGYMLERARRKQAAEGSRQRHSTELASYMMECARSVVMRAEDLAESILEDPNDVLDEDWEYEEDRELLKHLLGEEYLDTLIMLSNTARKLVAQQPTLVEVEAPCKIFGDIHGQLRDLLFLFSAFGLPSHESAPSFVFNGDFVDRGSHQVTTIAILLAMKVMMPEKVWLIRGNHEDRIMNERYGFQAACSRVLGNKFGPKVYECFHKVFDHLPVACLISKRVLVLHGGIGNGQWGLRDLRSIKRPLSTNALLDPANKWILNLLWSDPIEEDDSSKLGVFGVHPSPRGQMGLCFAWDLTRVFCARNGLGLIVRSHQSKQGSLGFDVMHDNMLVRVFSARDYEAHGNDGAVLLVQPSLAADNLLTVRPQVLRSVTKVADEAIVRNVDPMGLKSLSRRESMAVMRSTLRREAMFRNSRQVINEERLPEEEPLYKGWLYRLRESGDRMLKADWLYQEVSILRSGCLITPGGQDQGWEMLVESLACARFRKVASQQTCQPFALQILFQKPDGEIGTVILAAESSQSRHKWIRELKRISSV